MPTFPEESLAIVSRNELTQAQVVVMHPDDFHTLRRFLRGEYPWNPVAVGRSFTIQRGTRVVSDRSQPAGFVSIVDAPGQHLEPPEPPLPVPVRKSLWEHLADDEDE